ncbi:MULTISPECIES: sigma-70 family RNA polymerase sigma factor [unclassified Eubacterium (in: firmicutes)]|uniref:sigma-70 family RNA polymerase sigma factor n=1 Tax=unclassified Eubacterium (in: firmicutes) TaxID=2624479 RepID=UPI001565DCC9|nr:MULTISPECIES: sigma-70 family RNA polymerase sigma factor [unclassified Eubacterium (in: firmicutes)]
MNCQSCGKEIPEQSKFCPFCGTKNENESEMKDIVREAIEGKVQAVEKLYNMTYAQGFSVAMQIVRNEQDAMDLLQDAYVSVFENLNQLSDPEKFKSWFHCIVANKCRDWIKKKKPELFCSLESDDDDRDFEDTLQSDCIEFIPEKQVDYNETKRLIKEILDNLPEDQRLCVLMYYYDELSVNDIAKALECSDGTVKSRLNYARKKIKDEVEALERKGTKLYGIAPIPFIIWMLRENEVHASAGEHLLHDSILPQISSSSVKKSHTVKQTVKKVKAPKTVVTKAIAGVVGAAVLGTAGFFAYNHIQEEKKNQEIAQEKQQEKEDLQNLMDHLDYEYLVNTAKVLPNYTDISEVSDYHIESMLGDIFYDAFVYMEIHSYDENSEYENQGVIKCDEMQYERGSGLYGGATVTCSEKSLKEFWDAVNLPESPEQYIERIYDKDYRDITYSDGMYRVALSGLGGSIEETCEYIKAEKDEENQQIKVYYKKKSFGFDIDKETYKTIVVCPSENACGYEIVKNYDDPDLFQISEDEKGAISSAAMVYDDSHRLAENFQERSEYKIDLKKDISNDELAYIAGEIGYNNLSGEELYVEDIAVEGPQKSISSESAKLLLEGTFDYPVSSNEDIEKIFEKNGADSFVLTGFYSGSADTLYSFVDAEQTGENEYHFYVAVRPWAGSDYQTAAIMDITAKKNSISEIAGFVFERIEFTKITREAWQNAYMNYIGEREKGNEASMDIEYNLVYIDDDDVPELLVYSGYTAGGGNVVTYYDNSIKDQYVANYGVSYIEKSGLFTSSAGRMDSYGDIVYRLNKGTFEELGHGKFGIFNEVNPSDYGEDRYEYFWNDQKVTKEEYDEELKKVYAGDIVVPDDEMYSAEEIIDKIEAFSVENMEGK